MKGHKKIRRLRLVYLITGLVILSVLGTSTIQLIAAYRAQKAALYDTTFALNYESAQKMNVTMNTLFSSMKRSLSVMADHISQSGHSIDSIQNELDFFTESSGYFNSTVFVGEDGITRNISPSSIGLTNQKLSSEAAVKSLETRKPVVSSPYVSSTNKLILFMTHPVYNSSGQYAGYIGGTIYLREKNVLTNIFGSYTDSKSYAYVVDGQGNLLYHPDKIRLGDSVTENKLVAKVIAGNQGYGEVINTQGKAYLAGYAYSSENGWGIVVQTPLELIKAESQKMIYKVALISLPLFLIILLVSVWLGKMLAAPFSSLAETAKKLVSGSRVSDLPKAVHWNYEAYHLNETILLTLDTLQQRVESYSMEAQTDPLTGLANRRTMDANLNHWLEENKAFSVIALDIDHFKAVNDAYGHQTGDEVLKYAASVLLSVTREQDFCCRYGGEEFVILLPDTFTDKAYKIAERIRKKLESQPSPSGKPITVSAGVASYPYDSSRGKPILECADQALYAAKRNGRNRTVAYSAAVV